MPHSAAAKRGRRRAGVKTQTNQPGKTESRYTVGLTPVLARQVEQYAKTIDTSMSKAIAGLVRLGLESQANRRREFFKKLRENLANDDPKRENQLVDEFRDL